jgi:alkanesulfonate monooxygenase SsuD/methylene tetrahydromethanopterin reductase-like flavin-dependent oxidoreductase (luciferase family)
MWNGSGSPEQMKERGEVLRKHGDAVGRDTERIEKVVLMPFAYGANEERVAFLCNIIASMDQTTPRKARERMMVGGKQECLDRIEQYLRAGVTHFVLMLIMPFIEDEIIAFAEDVVPSVRSTHHLTPREAASSVHREERP